VTQTWLPANYTSREREVRGASWTSAARRSSVARGTDHLRREEEDVYAIAIHTISDPDKFWAEAQNLQVPSNLTLHSVVAKQDRTKAVCLWEGDSVDTVRDFVESAAGDISNNEYYEVNDQTAMGLPAASVGAAS
jgi:hypothetical protein